MSDKTGIEWTDATWNPVTGCTKVSAGCKNCYAERDWHRLVHLPRFAGRAFTDVACHPDVLDRPLRWNRPRRIFVNSMSDLFHPAVPDEFIDKAFAVMALAPQHTFQVLTKRPGRMAAYLGDEHRAEAIGWAEHEVVPARISSGVYQGPTHRRLPLPNVWLGVSVEDQDTAEDRIPLLLKTPAAVRWISAEPLLGPIYLRNCEHPNYTIPADYLGGVDSRDPPDVGTIDWVVVGGESGPHARSMDPEWVCDLRDQCAETGVPMLFKQWGEWAPTGNDPTVARLRRVGKRAAGRLLDGAQHDGYPEPRP